MLQILSMDGSISIGRCPTLFTFWLDSASVDLFSLPSFSVDRVWYPSSMLFWISTSYLDISRQTVYYKCNMHNQLMTSTHKQLSAIHLQKYLQMWKSTASSSLTLSSVSVCWHKHFFLNTHICCCSNLDSCPDVIDCFNPILGPYLWYTYDFVR